MPKQSPSWLSEVQPSKSTYIVLYKYTYIEAITTQLFTVEADTDSINALID